MLEEQLQISIDNINTTTKTISIKKVNIIIKDGVEISRADPLRCAFYPGQIEDVKTFTGWNDLAPEVIYLNAIWTPEVIDAYQLLLSTQ